MTNKTCVMLLAVALMLGSSFQEQAAKPSGEKNGKERTVEPVNVKTMVVLQEATDGQQGYSGTIEEMSETSLSFSSVGTLRSVNVGEGQMVRQGIRMQNAWNNVVEARQQLEIAQSSIEQAEENLRLHRDYYRVGTCKMSDLLVAQFLYQQAYDKRTDAYTDLQNKFLEYKQATGQKN